MELIRSEKPATFKHLCNPGDLIAAMAAMKGYHRETGRKVRVLQQIDVPANYYPSAVHGTVSSDGAMVCMNQHIFDMIKPLVESQEYIDSMEVFTGQDVEIDLDVIRKKFFVNLPHGQIQAWVFLAYPDLAWDLSKDWITLPETDLPVVNFIKDKIILNFTERYRNGIIHYHFLKKYQKQLVFAGTEKEYFLFTNKWRLDIPRLDVKDFLELAYAIKNCKFLLCNQSFQYNCSYAMHTPHILELCEFAANCPTFTYENSYGFYHQVNLEYYCHRLMGEM